MSIGDLYPILGLKLTFLIRVDFGFAQTLKDDAAFQTPAGTLGYKGTCLNVDN